MMKRCLGLLLCAVFALGVVGRATSIHQTPAKPDPQTIKLPADRSTQLKQIQDRQDLLRKEYDSLESQKVIVAQRAALELHLTAEKLDTLQLTVTPDGVYAFEPKKQAAATPEKKDTP